MELFIKRGQFCIIDRTNNESDESFAERGWFVASQPLENHDQDIPKYSRLWLNWRYSSCTYNATIMKNLEEMEKNVFVTSSQFKHAS